MELRLVIDTNIIIAALIKDSVSRKLLLHPDLVIFVIDYSLEEIKRYESIIIEKSGKDKQNTDFVLRSILSKALIIESPSIKTYFDKARGMIGAIDEKDVPFVAAALAFKNDGIWSEDPHFDSIKNKMKIWKTKELLGYIFGK